MNWATSSSSSLIQSAPDLRERIIILRSATKAHSAAGERMGMLMVFDSTLMNALRDQSISSIGHSPRSAQMAYATMMDKFSEQDKCQLKEFYFPKVKYVIQRLQSMGATMPDTVY
jgi:aspartate/methionine/tyrosine aminotransferase